MGLFGRKPRMVGFGDPKVQETKAPKRVRSGDQHSGKDHREAEISEPSTGPWADTDAPVPSQELQMQISELKKKAPAIGNMVERLASKGPAGLGSVSTDISRIFWRVMWIFILLFFVLPIIAGIVTAFIP